MRKLQSTVTTVGRSCEMEASGKRRELEAALFVSITIVVTATTTTTGITTTATTTAIVTVVTDGWGWMGRWSGTEGQRSEQRGWSGT